MLLQAGKVQAGVALMVLMSSDDLEVNGIISAIRGLDVLAFDLLHFSEFNCHEVSYTQRCNL